MAVSKKVPNWLLYEIVNSIYWAWSCRDEAEINEVLRNMQGVLEIPDKEFKDFISVEMDYINDEIWKRDNNSYPYSDNYWMKSTLKVIEEQEGAKNFLKQQKDSNYATK